MVVADTAAMAAAEEARSGVWACDLDRKALPKVLAPGMPHGVFGPWQQESKHCMKPTKISGPYLCLIQLS